MTEPIEKNPAGSATAAPARAATAVTTSDEAGEVAGATVAPPRRPHYPCLEGIRALAAALIVVHHSASLAEQHAGLLATPARVMDIGVSVFFVLSGFLIYRPFVSAHLDGQRPMSARRFWWRRLLRIVPAYWVALSVLWAVGNLALGSDWWRYYLFLNIYDAFTSLGGIVPAWSLATEITFYLCIPFWSGLIRRVIGRGRTTVRIELLGVGGLVVAGYASRALFSASHHYFVSPGTLTAQGVTMRAVSFTWLPNNIDLFALGMALAVLSAWNHQQSADRPLDRLLGRATGLWWCGAVAVFAYLAYGVGPPPFATGYAGFFWQRRQFLYGLVGVLLITPAVFGDQTVGFVRRVLRCRPLVWLGSISYGLYLWHLDLMSRVVNKPGALGGLVWRGWSGQPLGQAPLWAVLSVGFGLGTLAAAASWYGVERPLQRLKRWV